MSSNECRIFSKDTPNLYRASTRSCRPVIKSKCNATTRVTRSKCQSACPVLPAPSIRIPNSNDRQWFSKVQVLLTCRRVKVSSSNNRQANNSRHNSHCRWRNICRQWRRNRHLPHLWCIISLRTTAKHHFRRYRCRLLKLLWITRSKVIPIRLKINQSNLIMRSIMWIKLRSVLLFISINCIFQQHSIKNTFFFWQTPIVYTNSYRIVDLVINLDCITFFFFKITLHLTQEIYYV